MFAWTQGYLASAALAVFTALLASGAISSAYADSGTGAARNLAGDLLQDYLDDERTRMTGKESDAPAAAEALATERSVFTSKDFALLAALGGSALLLLQLRRTAAQNRELQNSLEQLSQEVCRRQLSEQKLLRAKDKAQAAERTKSDFLSSISHELRTPMNGIIGFTEILLSGPLAAEQREQVEIIDKSSRSVLTLINELLDRSQLEAGTFKLRPRPFDLREAAEEACGTLRGVAQRKNLDLRCEIDPALESVAVGDRQRLRQILLNLLGNALKFTDEGSVTFSVEPSARAGEVLFSIRDTGIGIPAEKISSLFSRYARLDQGSERSGTGLGLSISRQLAEAMGGTIGCRSIHGQGSTFWLRVPLGAANAGSKVESFSDDAHRAASPKRHAALG